MKLIILSFSILVSIACVYKANGQLNNEKPKNDNTSFNFIIETFADHNNYKFVVDDAVNFEVDWGNGNVDVYQGTVFPEHTYGEAGHWTIKVSGEASRISFGYSYQPREPVNYNSFKYKGEPEYPSYAQMLKDILTPVSDGVNGITSTHRMFAYTEIESFTCDHFLDDISADIYDMSEMFAHSAFNQDISNWDVSSVTNMEGMFYDSSFSQDINTWDVGNVINMGGMFAGSVFNKNIEDWDVSSVTNMSAMFLGSPFNQDINIWDVSNVINMGGMFAWSAFNNNIEDWDVSNVANITAMFKNSSFNQDLSNWNVSNVTNMFEIFHGSDFNNNVGTWDVGNVTDMAGMFQESNFNQDIGNWNTSNVLTMSSMFESSAFDHDISHWDVSNVYYFHNFLANSHFSTDHYNEILIKWSYQDLKENVHFNAGNSKHDLGLPAERKQYIMDVFAWTIIDGGDTGEEWYGDENALPSVSETKYIRLYPNPAKDILKIESELLIKHINVLDMYGQIITKSNVNADGLSIILNNFVSGFYVIEIILSNNRVVRNTFQIIK